jgi:hypothetical protein
LSLAAFKVTPCIVQERLQVQAGPHLQALPQRQPVFAGSALERWHPHWQAAPGQALQEHWVDLDMISFLSIWLTCCQLKRVSHPSCIRVLNGAAIDDG